MLYYIRICTVYLFAFLPFIIIILSLFCYNCYYYDYHYHRYYYFLAPLAGDLMNLLKSTGQACEPNLEALALEFSSGFFVLGIF